MSWSYTADDPGLRLFTACLSAGAPMRLEPGMRVLEIACCETDWLHLAHDMQPDVYFTGIDTRAPDVIDTGGGVTRMCANAMDADLFKPESFDAIVSLSAIEHVGLGHYGDPIDPDGDSKALANAWRWLKPGGWLYFDVPYDPTGYRVQGTKCRVYDHWSHWLRLWVEPLAAAKASAQYQWKAFATATEPGVLVVEPIRAVQPFHYVATVWEKLH